MGEVLGGAIALIVVVVLLVGGIGAVSQYQRANRPEVETPQYRNHLAMARWIEHTLGDDMERVVIPEPRQRAARKLLAAFYDEKETQ